MGRAHGVTASTTVTPEAARQVARLMSGLGTQSRVEILGRLRQGACSVSELTDAVRMAQPAVSHQLRILRDLDLVTRGRRGRHAIYGLYDPHVAVLLDEGLRHVAHLRAGAPQMPQSVPGDNNQTTNGVP